jgi:hypothetical protein
MQCVTIADASVKVFFSRPGKLSGLETGVLATGTKMKQKMCSCVAGCCCFVHNAAAQVVHILASALRFRESENSSAQLPNDIL